MTKIAEYLKNIFLILILIQILPFLITNFRKNMGDIFEPKTKVGILSFNSAVFSSDYYTKELQKNFKDSDIKAIVLHFKNAPGGTAGAGQVIFMQLQELKKLHVKPVLAVIEDCCGSAAYYIAAATDYIIAAPSSDVGSIGVYIARPQFKEFIEQFKIKYDVTQSGEYKTTGNPLVAPTPAQLAMLQRITDDCYEQFVNDVAASRPKLNKNSKEWADGKIFTGREGLKLGLVDELGTLLTAERILKEKLLIKGEIEWVKPEKSGFVSSFFHRDTQENEGSMVLFATNVLQNLVQRISTL
jgi:protease-4